jgi:hypothetical protein
MRKLRYIFIVVYGLLAAFMLYRLVITDGLTSIDYILMIIVNISGLIILLRDTFHWKKGNTK